MPWSLLAARSYLVVSVNTRPLIRGAIYSGAMAMGFVVLVRYLLLVCDSLFAG